MLTKKQIKEIKTLAKDLPISYYEVGQNHLMMGSEILADKQLMEMYEGEVIDPKKSYEVKKKLLHHSNHKRQMIKAFDQDGWDGVVLYCEQIKGMHKVGETPMDLHSRIL